MATRLPSDEMGLESLLSQKIAEIFTRVVDHNSPDSVEDTYTVAKVLVDNDEPDTRDRDIEMTTINDPITLQPRTAVIEVSIPTVEEAEYSSDQSTQLIFTYPITMDIQIFSDLRGPGAVYRYENSKTLVKAIYMRSRRLFKNDRTFGYDNCVHNFLQQVSAVKLDDDDTGTSLYAIDWSIDIYATGILV